MHPVAADIASRHGELLELLADLVAADSAQPRGDTRAAAGVLASYLRHTGLSPELRGRVVEKPSVVCWVEGGGAGPTLGFNGHLDTLPADGWSVPPLTLTRRDDMLLGLGIGNMKAGLAGLAVALVALSRHRALWRGRCVLTAVPDEVLFGPDGAGWLLETDPALRGDALINAEGPGEMGLAVAEKGLLWLELTAVGPPGQGMLAVRGASPIARVAAALVAMDAWNDETVIPPTEIAGVAIDAGAHRLRLSVNLGSVTGGDLVSQVATRAAARVDIRVPPGLPIDEVQARVAALGVEVARLKGWDANWTSPDAAVSRAMMAAARAVRGAAPKLVVRLPASDAARWRALGVPCVSYGPQHPLASGPDDAVQVSDVQDCAAVYALAAIAILQTGA